MTTKKCIWGIGLVLIILTVVSMWLGIQLYRHDAEASILETIWYILLIFLSFAFGVSGGFFTYYLLSYLRITEERIKTLEKNGQKRHTHATAAGLEDALAVLVDVLREYQDSKLYAEARLKQLGEILRELRVGPNSYDEDRACGRRPVRRYEKK